MSASISARWIGSTIADLLERPSSGTTVAVFSRSCYLELRGRIVALVSPALGRGPLNIVAEPRAGFSFGAFAVGAAVRLAPPALTVDPDIRIDLSDAAVWNAGLAALSAGDRARASRWRWAAGHIAEVLAEAPAASLAHPASRSARAARGMDALFAGLRTGDRTAAATGTALLAGLGAGLTPSGDDVLLGVLVAAALADRARASAIGAEVLKAARGRTTRISLAYLEAASRGEVGEAWHLLARALEGDSDDAVQEATRRVLATGETSGADMLAGFLLGLRAWAPAGPRR
ncbi:MAG: DUF2877 domain-containing protein [Armatimonadota bacterium]|nr:DUF2877 domain-containing protein [Armatimonadota bacterium]MDR7452305.1 DUF2877 domain-containing protein [Armatimonadota bacterium]MDR7467804.1 DUF2877 domain-containing protein [Armatimonadota bacterium]MDR7494610.1 DUF2877 domain-containing protein [Armatimonadota bacterium]MDR7499670.1 DUF2877 domain-containing protein [Armatimonadota bacterium]